MSWLRARLVFLSLPALLACGPVGAAAPRARPVSVEPIRRDVRTSQQVTIGLGIASGVAAVTSIAFIAASAIENAATA